MIGSTPRETRYLAQLLGARPGALKDGERSVSSNITFFH
ncbi:hypothetical protein PAMC26510_32840 [Caballeronia sordidicola]|uniref:Uncharacterized protein n=1 Tax=Caballeronia sordidicola TaxID=196367 RepID=A0A242M6A2_CABSO|nr:hypothetical protein PAMC26510_32840 [Caballeronia sordidicola]